jgi:hypothetical protein
MKPLIVTMMMAGALFAQEGKGVVNRRIENQGDRIEQGENHGTLTNKEANRLEHKQGNIAAEVARDRANNDGHLTAAERAKVNRQQNRLSGKIYRQKHD